MPKRNNILVCVTRQDTVARLLQTGHTYQVETSGVLHALHVTTKNLNANTEKIEFFSELCKEYDARFGVVKSENVLKSIQDYINEHKINTIIIGQTRQNEMRKSMMYKLQQGGNTDKHLIIVPVLETEDAKEVI